MKIQTTPPLHLTYCLNIHAGETWAENFAAIERYALRVKGCVAPDKPFGLGLRLGRHAADSLAAPSRRESLRNYLDNNGLYVFTINGFPYGEFHGTRVKEQVYAPDWRTPERRDYTILLADILADLLPDGVRGSLSTVPVSFKPWMTNESDLKAAVANLHACAEHLVDRNVCLALEPEPGCVLETTEEAIRFFLEQLSESAREVIGVCFDTCHAAVQFEDPAGALQKYLSSGIRVAKIQLSAALEAGNVDALKPFRDEVYLHQTKLRRANGSTTMWTDLPLATEDGMIRTHFHVPLFFEGSAGLRSTASDLTAEFFALVKAGATEHLEIETYTFDVLPPDLRPADVVDSIVREYAWVLARTG
jgi:sugar phosphate isomerase/epimerase